MSATNFADHQSPKAQSDPGLLLSKGLLTTLLDLVFPPRCAGCQRVDWRWCPACEQAVAALPYPPLPQLGADAPLKAVAATGIHEHHLQHAVHALKFDNEREIAVPMGKRLHQRLMLLNWQIDMLVPVPLHTRRLQERGYNQSQLLAETLAVMMPIPLLPQAINRQVATRSQVGLSAIERRDNMVGVFSADPALVTNQTILLIDDVYTTGATLSACAQAALAAGARQVFGLTVTQARR